MFPYETSNVATVGSLILNFLPTDDGLEAKDQWQAEPRGKEKRSMMRNLKIWGFLKMVDSQVTIGFNMFQ